MSRTDGRREIVGRAGITYCEAEFGAVLPRSGVSHNTGDGVRMPISVIARHTEWRLVNGSLYAPDAGGGDEVPAARVFGLYR